MSTRSTTHFISGGKTRAIVYRHPDGYPEGHGVDLQRFFADVEEQAQDTRFNDASYLAAKLVVWLADMFADKTMTRTEADEARVPILENAYKMGDTEYVRVKARMLDFLSVGVMMEDPGDIEYRYEVDCDAKDEKGRPVVKCLALEWGDEPRASTEVAIPEAEEARP